MSTAPRRSADLTDGLAPGERAELGDLGRVAARLAGYVAPRPAPEETEALLAALRPLVAERAPWPTRTPAPALAGLRHLLSLAWSQTTLLEPAFWWSSGLLLLLGLVVVLLDPQGPLPVAFLLASPVLGAGAVAYAFRSSVRSAWELELASPIRPLELLYARLGLVMIFSLVSSLALLGVLWAQEPRLVLWRLVLAWFGPMLCLAGVALYSTVRWGSIAGAAVPAGLWAALVITGLQTAGRPGQSPLLVLAQMLPLASQSGAVLLGSGVAAALGLLLLRQAGRLTVGDAASWN